MTGQAGRRLEERALLRREIEARRKRHGREERADPAARVGDHLLDDVDGRSRELDTVPLGDERHRRDEARAEGRGAQVRRGKSVALAPVVDGGVGHELRSGRAVGRLAVEVARVDDVDVDGHTRTLREAGPPVEGVCPATYADGPRSPTRILARRCGRGRP
ncbi:MAG: hypothetical protein IPF66_17175 [Holophagales bacterium]|nr:hypothetical protein [Holophagales bacterium]